LPASAAAVLSLVLLGAGTVALLLLLAPLAIGQVQQLAADLPALMTWVQGQAQRVISALQQRGVDVAPLQEELFLQLGKHAGGAVSRLAGVVSRGVAGASRVLLSPLVAF
jgi:predicted PurR-regulated permease PerM